jgi:hypothetical protein
MDFIDMIFIEKSITVLEIVVLLMLYEPNRKKQMINSCYVGLASNHSHLNYT